MAALQTVDIADNVLLTDEVEVLVELTHLNIGNATGDVDLAIIEKHTGVVVDARQLLLLPFALWVGSRKQPAAGVVAIDEQVELAVVVLHRAGPHTLAVSILAVL